MKTVSTKVDESVYQKLVESCGKSGRCVSERLRKLIEASLEAQEDKNESEYDPHYDKYGNYWTWNKDKKIWTCHIDLSKSVKS